MGLWPALRVERTTLSVAGAGLLLFLAGPFMSSGVMEKSGITLGLMYGVFHPLVGGSAVGLSLVTVVPSNLVSNAPAILLPKPVVTILPDPQPPAAGLGRRPDRRRDRIPPER